MIIGVGWNLSTCSARAVAYGGAWRRVRPPPARQFGLLAFIFDYESDDVCFVSFSRSLRI